MVEVGIFSLKIILSRNPIYQTDKSAAVLSPGVLWGGGMRREGSKYCIIGFPPGPLMYLEGRALRHPV